MDCRFDPSATIKSTFLIKTASLQKPDIVGVFSSERLPQTGIRLDASNCKYFKKQLLAEENFPIDLKLYKDILTEYEKRHSVLVPTYQPVTLFLDYLENFVTQDKFTRCSENKLFHADIICHAKVLIKMMMVHGDVNETFSLLCTKYKGNIYICQHKKPHEMRKEHIKMTARHVLYSDNPQVDVNSSVPGITKFHCVFDWKLGDSSIMYCCGVQGVCSDTEILPETDLSKVTTARIKFQFPDSNDRILAMYQSPYWWGQSLVLGTTEIHVANVNGDNVIEKINTISVDKFRHNNEKKWKKSSSERVSFLSLMMDLIKLRMRQVNCPLSVYEFHYNPKIQTSVHCSILEGENVYTFLSDKYVDVIRDL